jgi:Bacterial protein of unknown function (DUF894).
VLPELVPKNELGPALALNGLGINISRVIGPALGGLVIGAAGVGATFLINAMTFFAVSSPMPAGGRRAQKSSAGRALHRRHPQRLAFTREAPALKATLVHAGTFFLFAAPIGRCCR